jgi:hypothetical protein
VIVCAVVYQLVAGTTNDHITGTSWSQYKHVIVHAEATYSGHAGAAVLVHAVGKEVITTAFHAAQAQSSKHLVHPGLSPAV